MRTSAAVIAPAPAVNQSTDESIWTPPCWEPISNVAGAVGGRPAPVVVAKGPPLTLILPPVGVHAATIVTTSPAFDHAAPGVASEKASVLPLFRLIPIRPE